MEGQTLENGYCPYCGSFEGVDDPPLMAYGACYSCAPQVKPDTSEEKAAAEIEAYWSAAGDDISENPTEPFTPIVNPDDAIFRGEGD
jgi:hypothetical protein